MNAASARLAQSLRALEESSAFHAAVQSDAERGLKELDDAERENKDAVRDAGEKEAWFREFDEFVENVAAFLDDKVCSAFCKGFSDHIIQKKRSCADGRVTLPLARSIPA